MKSKLVLTLCLWLAGCASTEPPKALLGAYRLDDGRTVSIRRSVDDTLRYRIYESGKSGRLYAESEGVFMSGRGFSAREPVEIEIRFDTVESGNAQSLEWRSRGDGSQTAQRIGTEREAFFESGGTRLFARLHLPLTPPPYPAVVLVHGSGDSPGTEWFYNSDFFVAKGFAALTYDKRGSGRSDGQFTFDFEQLAEDVVAAVDYLQTLPEIDNRRIGLAGYSQGAWVAPLAASKTDSIRFVVVNYGMIQSPAEEARLEMRQILIDAGVADDDLAAADGLILAAVDLVASEFEDGWAEFQAQKKMYRNASWLEHLDGTPVGTLVKWPRFLVKLIGPHRLPHGLDWHYDSTELLERSEIPMAWLLAEDDQSAPNEQTIATLRSLIDAGKPYSLAVFPNADHGMLTFTERDGERVYEGYAPGYFESEVDALTRLAGISPQKTKAAR